MANHYRNNTVYKILCQVFLVLFEKKAKFLDNIDSKTLIKKIKTAYQISTNPELANKLGLTVSAIEQWSKKNKVPEKYIFKCIKDTGVSMEFLLNKENNDEKNKKIYDEIFGDSFNTFTQTGANSTQIKTQTNSGENILNSSSLNKDTNIDSELLPLFEALSSVAIALDKKAQLKIELTKLISDLPKL